MGIPNLEFKMSDNEHDSFNKAVEAVRGERKFQLSLSKSDHFPNMVKKLSVGDTITAIDLNLMKAKAAWYIGSNDHPDAMKYLRKIAALCIQAGENYNFPERE